MCSEDQVSHFSYLYHYRSFCFVNSRNVSNACFASIPILSIIKVFVYYHGSLNLILQNCLCYQELWDGLSAKLRYVLPGKFLKNRIQLFGKFIHYLLNVLKFTLEVSNNAVKNQHHNKQNGRISHNMCMCKLNHDTSCHRISQMWKVYMGFRGNQASSLSINQLWLLNTQEPCQEVSDLQMAGSLWEG